MLYERNNFSCSEEIFELFNKKRDRKEKYKATTNHCQKGCTNKIHRGSEQRKRKVQAKVEVDLTQTNGEF